MANPVFGYRPHRNRNYIPSGTPVNVIANFNLFGDFIPIYFQVDDDRGERFSYKISSVDLTKDKPGLRIFVCSFIADEEKHTIELQYELDTARWVVAQLNTVFEEW